jgi:hypothetical protein
VRRHALASFAGSIMGAGRAAPSVSSGAPCLQRSLSDGDLLLPQTAGAHGAGRVNRGRLVLPSRRSRSTRCRSTFASTSAVAASSRAAVAGATSPRRQEPAGLADPAGVDGKRGAQSPVVCRPSTARLANTPAAVVVSAPSLAHAAETTASVRARAVDAPRFTGLMGTSARLPSLTRIAAPPLTAAPRTTAAASSHAIPLHITSTSTIHRTTTNAKESK